MTVALISAFGLYLDVQSPIEFIVLEIRFTSISFTSVDTFLRPPLGLGLFKAIHIDVAHISIDSYLSIIFIIKFIVYKINSHLTSCMCF